MLSNSTKNQNRLIYPVRDNIAFTQNRTVSSGLPSFYVVTLLYYPYVRVSVHLDCLTLIPQDSYSSFFVKKKQFRTSLSISDFSGRLGRYAHAYGIFANFYYISQKTMRGKLY